LTTKPLKQGFLFSFVFFENREEVVGGGFAELFAELPGSQTVWESDAAADRRRSEIFAAEAGFLLGAGSGGSVAGKKGPNGP
jgi:hypothetical protein